MASAFAAKTFGGWWRQHHVEREKKQFELITTSPVHFPRWRSPVGKAV
jgi:hypothetical protein